MSSPHHPVLACPFLTTPCCPFPSSPPRADVSSPLRHVSGIDIEGVEHVINYDMPKDIESYTHRIGRTGVSTTFVTGEGVEHNGVLYDLKMLLASCKQTVPAEFARLPGAQDAETRERNKKPKLLEARSARD